VTLRIFLPPSIAVPFPSAVHGDYIAAYAPRFPPLYYAEISLGI
jgi:hypothetical protein